jgi:carboxyvinyl-carboxyphosphonate phosphorylmutase
VTTFRQRRYGLRAILSGDRCMRPGSVYDAISVRIAEDLGFEVGMFGARRRRLPFSAIPTSR